MSRKIGLLKKYRNSLYKQTYADIWTETLREFIRTGSALLINVLLRSFSSRIYTVMI